MPQPDLPLKEACRERDLTIPTQPEGVVPYAAWMDALRDVSIGVRSGHVVVLSGLPGVGKTSLLHALSTLLRQGGRPVALLQPDQPPPAAVLLVDDAHRMSEDALQAALSHPAACVLAGGPALAILAGGLSRRVTTVALHPVPPGAAPGFVAALMREGGQAIPFTPGAAERLQALGRGLPGVMAQVARSAIGIASQRSAALVGPDHVEQAWQDQAAAKQVGANQAAPPRPAPQGAVDRVGPAAPPDRQAVAPAVPRRRRWPAVATIGLAAGLAVLLLVRPRRIEPVQPAAFASNVPEPAPVVVPAPRLAPLPTEVALHVVLVAPPDAAERAARVAETLALLGYDMAGQRVAAVRPASLEVQYGYAEDAPAAARLAEAIGAGPATARPRPESANALSAPGTVEVMVPSTGPLRSGLSTARSNQGD